MYSIKNFGFSIFAYSMFIFIGLVLFGALVYQNHKIRKLQKINREMSISLKEINVDFEKFENRPINIEIQDNETKDDLALVKPIESTTLFDNEKLDCEISLLTDDYEDIKTIQFTKVGNHNSEYFNFYIPDTDVGFYTLGMSLINHNGHSYISFYSRYDGITMAKDDTLIFLSEDRVKHSLKFNNTSNGAQGNKRNSIRLTRELLDYFLNKNIKGVKYLSQRKNEYTMFSLNHAVKIKGNKGTLYAPQYTTIEQGQKLLRYMTFKFIEFNKMNQL